MGLKKFFVPKRTDGEKFLLTMQKQKSMVHAFYIAMILALSSAFVKVFAFRATPMDIISEELIFFIPLLYYAVRQVTAGLETAKKVNPKGAYPMLLLLALIAGVFADLCSFAGLFVFCKMAEYAFMVSDAAMVSGGIGIFTSLLFYLFIWLIIHRDKKGANPAVQTAVAQNNNK